MSSRGKSILRETLLCMHLVADIPIEGCRGLIHRRHFL
jgi:hypothetical protein